MNKQQRTEISKRKISNIHTDIHQSKIRETGTLPLFEQWAELDDQLVVCPLKILDKKEESINLDLENCTRKRETKSLNARFQWLLELKNTSVHFILRNRLSCSKTWGFSIDKNYHVEWRIETHLS